MSRVGKPGTIKEINRTVVLELLRREGPVSRAAIARRVELSPPAVSGIIAELLGENLAVEVGPGTAPNGRRPTLIDHNADAGMAIAVDATGAAITVGVLNFGGELLSKRTVSVPQSDPLGSVDVLISTIREVLEESPRDGKRVGVGIGAPGVTNVRTGVVEWAPILGWKGLALRDVVAEATGLPVFVDNDVNMAVLGESWVGAARDTNSVVYLAIRDGIGSGVILNGHLWRGHDNAAGEAGYLVLERNVIGSDTRNFGALERLAAGPAILRRALQGISGSELLETGIVMDGTMTVESVVKAAQQGNLGGIAAVTETCQYLAMAVANVAALLNPEMVVMQSNVAGLVDLFLPQVDAIVELLVPHKPAIVQSQLGNDAVLYGATQCVLRMLTGGISVVTETP